LKAIKDTGGILFAAMDKSDSVGVLDSYFPECNFFTEYERFERYLEKIRVACGGIDYLVVCTPNYLHDSHIRCGLRLGMKVICEKPVVVHPHNLKAILDLGGDVFTISQMKLHPTTKLIQEYLKTLPTSKRGGDWQYVEIDYVAPRGNWYDYSWKAEDSKSGGLIYNIGIHLLDLMVYLFGNPVGGKTECYGKHYGTGDINLERARVRWTLSTDGDKPKRIVRVGEKEFDYSGNFGDLHTECYKSILAGDSLFRAASMMPAIDLADSIRNTSDTPNSSFRFGC